jgi:hypothetical protein
LDEYVEVFSAPTPQTGSTGEKIVLDMDQDGRKEIAVCGLYGYLHVFESLGDDQWQHVWMDSTGLANAYAAEGGTDTDGNGRPELFIHGNDFFASPPTWPARVYEAAADNDFRLVATIPVPAFSGSGRPIDASGDLEGDGDREYVALEFPESASHMGGVWIYTSTGVGAWQAVAMIENPGGLSDPFMHDMNVNGKADIVWRGSPTSLVWEHETATDVEVRLRPPMLTVTPNPIMRTAWIRWSPTDPIARSLIVYDVAGRLVERYNARGESLEWRPARTSAGVYFIQLRDERGTALATARVLVMPTK